MIGRCAQPVQEVLAPPIVGGDLPHAVRHGANYEASLVGHATYQMGDDGGVRTLSIIVMIALGTALLLAFILIVLEQPGDDD